jgi:lysophospholipase L1-like esterase
MSSLPSGGASMFGSVDIPAASQTADRGGKLRTLAGVQMSDCRLGVLAFGDSITNAGGELQWGVAMHSWAHWVARGLGLPYTGCAVDGACGQDVVKLQIPAFQRYAAHPDARYDVGCLYMGVNDVRGPEWDPEGFAEACHTALSFLAARCDRVLAATLPLDLGRPRASAARMTAANQAIRRAVDESGALLVDLSGFRARNHVMADRVHPTAFGQIAIAQRALAVLAADGLVPRVLPSQLIAYETTRWGRLRGDTTYVYRYLKGIARGTVRLTRAR